MATESELRSAIDRLLNIVAVRRALQLNGSGAERAYEVYVLSLSRQAVLNLQGSAVVTGIRSGPNPPVYVFRGGPGSMGSNAQDFCYVDCRLGNKCFEIHVDVEYVGQSGATHEIDVSFYDSQKAEAVRSISSTSPRTNKPLIVAIECKFYSNSTPGVSLARTFVGLTSDCAGNKLKGFASNRTSIGIDRFLSKSNSPEPFTDLTPLNQDGESRFIRFLEQRLKKWASSR